MRLASFRKLCTLARRPNIQFEIESFNEQNVQQAAYETAKVFEKHDLFPVIGKHDFKLIYEDYVLPMAVNALKENLSYSLYDRTNNKWVASAIFEDAMNAHLNPYLHGDSEKKLQIIIDFMEYIDSRTMPIIGKPTKPFQYIHGLMLAVNPDYMHLGVGGLMSKFFIKEHPLGKSAQMIYMEATNSFSCQALMHQGFEVLYEEKWADIREPKLKDLNPVNEIMRRQGFDHFEKFYFCALKREAQNF